MSLVTVSAAEGPEESCKNNYFYVNYSGNKQYKCFDDLSNAADSVEDDETAEIVFVKGKTFNFVSNETIKSNVTLNLNKQSVTFSGNGVWQVEGANVTIKNGTLDMVPNSVAGRIKVNGADKATTLTIAKDVTVKGDRDELYVVEVTDATEKTVVNINGKWEGLVGELINCTANKADNLTVNLNATVKGASSLVILDAGKAVVNVNGGNYETTGDSATFILQNGTLNINAGTVKAASNSTIWVKEADEDYTNALTIKGKETEIISEDDVYEAIWFDGIKGTYSIADATVTSGENAKGDRIPALHVPNKEFLEKHPGMVKSGTFKGALVGDVKGDDGLLVKASEAEKDLVGNATVLNG